KIAKINFKSTVWEQLNLPEELTEEQEQLVLTQIADGKLVNSDEVFNFISENFGLDCNWEIVPETVEALTVKDNGNCATIEVSSHEGATLYTNEPKPEKDIEVIRYIDFTIISKLTADLRELSFTTRLKIENALLEGKIKSIKDLEELVPKDES